MRAVLAHLGLAIALWVVFAPPRRRVNVNPPPLYKRPAPPPIPAPVSGYLH
jgi:hypothetical protein